MALEVFFYVKKQQEIDLPDQILERKNGNHLKNAFFVKAVLHLKILNNQNFFIAFYDYICYFEPKKNYSLDQ